MTWPVPPELYIAGPSLTWDWEDAAAEERKLREYLEAFRLTEGRVILMAKQEEHEKISPGIEWSHEPWYGTPYNVNRWDPDFIQEVGLIQVTVAYVLTSPRLADLAFYRSCVFPGPTNLFLQTSMLAGVMLPR